MIISQSIDLAGLAHRERSLTLQCFLTWNSVQSDKIYPPYLFYFRQKKACSQPTTVRSGPAFFLTGAQITAVEAGLKGCTVPQMIPNRKWSRDRKWSPKWTANDPRPQVIAKVDRKWSRKKNRNSLDSRLRIIVSILLLLLQKVTLKAKFCFPNNYINKN